MTDLAPGTRLGVYAVSAKIGEGGMGEVYQARDTKLDRDVALKVLPEAFTADPDRLARFEREAKVLASLNHPNIGSIYGLAEANGGASRALVLELIEGPTLADRIAHGPIPLDDALPIATQIAEALEAAHEAGVIHRDLKPANIKVREDGTVKVLDFGLAKALDTTPEGDPSQSPTLTAAATQMGVIMGTAAYMAPEQARGKPVDKRADIWAFGAVLYEMVTGTMPFPGDDISQTLARVIDRDPDWDGLPATLSPALDTYLRRCLQKDPRQRVRDIGDVRLALEGAFEARVPQPEGASVVLPRQVWQRPVPAGVAVLAALGLGALAAGAFLGSGSAPPPSTTRLTLTVLPDADRLAMSNWSVLSLSPDGQTLVYVATQDGTPRLFRRPLDQFEATPMPGTENSRQPFFSPDGQWVGFVANRALLKVALSGGSPQTLTGLPTGFRGADWGADDMIVYGLSGAGGPLMQIPAGGGEPTPIFTPDDQRQSRLPQILPGGDAVLFTLGDPDPDANELRLVMLDTGDHRTLVANASQGRVLDTGHLVFVRSGALWAVPSSTMSASTSWETPCRLSRGVRMGGGGAAQFALADNGSLVYVPGGAGDGAHSLVWVDRNGDEEPLAAPLNDYSTLSVSPDGTRAAVGIRDGSGNDDVWVSELARGTLTRLTTDEAFDGNPLWSPDGRRVAFTSDRNGRLEVFWQAADGSGSAERLLTIDEPVSGIVPYGWSPDGATLLVQASFVETGIDAGMVSIEGPGTWEPLVQTAAHEPAPTISPDGRWLAYTSNETGRFEIYVQRFPELEDRRQISLGGGFRSSWSADGRELIYLGGPNGIPETVMRVPLDIDEGSPPSLLVGTPERLFDWRYFSTAGARKQHDLSPDGQRFLVIADEDEDEASAGTVQAGINVVLHWAEELKTRVPVP